MGCEVRCLPQVQMAGSKICQAVVRKRHEPQRPATRNNFFTTIEGMPQNTIGLTKQLPIPRQTISFSLLLFKDVF